MAELVTPDGKPVDAAGDVDREFARAMAANSPEPAAPPKRPEAAAEPPKRGRGRPRKDQAARVDAKPATAALSDEQRAQGVQGIIQIGAGVCLIASRTTGKVIDGQRVDNPAFKADAITLASSAADWATAAVDTARADPKFGALLDKVCAVGPYGALISVMLTTGTQLARNHRPAAALPGTTDPADLIRAAEQPAPAAAA